METKHKTPEGKTGAEIVLEWMRKYSEQNGTPTEFEIRCQLELAIDAEKLHHQEANAGQTKELDQVSLGVETETIIVGGFEIVAKLNRCEIPIGSLAVKKGKEYREKYPNDPSIVTICNLSNKDSIEEHWREVVSIKNIRQSQKPASIAWLTNEEIRPIAMDLSEKYRCGFGLTCEVFRIVRSELRKRVIDPVRFLIWCEENDWTLIQAPGGKHEGNFQQRGKYYSTGQQLLQKYVDHLTSKTK